MKDQGINYAEASDLELIDTYCLLDGELDSVDGFTFYAEIIREEKRKAYQELCRRDMGIYCALHHLGKTIHNHQEQTEELKSLVGMLEAQTSGDDGLFKDHFCEGDAISYTGSLLNAFLWVLEAGAEKEPYNASIADAAF